MKKHLLTLALLLAVSAAALAQSVSKQINDIKRNGDFISAEATMDTEAQAYQVAEELLSKQLEEYVGEQKALKKAPNVIVKDVAGKAEKLQMSRGTMTRVFLFVKKSDVIAADNTRVFVQPKNTPAKETVAKKKAEESKSAPQPAVAPQPTATPQPTAVPQPAASPQPAPVTEATEGDQSLRLQKTWQQTVIDDLLACANVTEARAKMNRMRAELKLKRYGSPDTCKNPVKSFWLIFDGEEIITILGPGTADRTNFRSLTIDNLKNYSGKDAIWFTMSN